MSGDLTAALPLEVFIDGILVCFSRLYSKTPHHYDPKPILHSFYCTASTPLASLYQDLVQLHKLSPLDNAYFFPFVRRQKSVPRLKVPD